MSSIYRIANGRTYDRTYYPSLIIVGPMSGYPGWNFAAFDAAAQQLTDAGYETVNPADIARKHGFDPAASPRGVDDDARRRALLASIRRISSAGGVALLPGWHASATARAEAAVADALGIPAHPIQNWFAGQFGELRAAS